MLGNIPSPQPPPPQIQPDLLWDWFQSGAICDKIFQEGMTAIHTGKDLAETYRVLAVKVNWIKYEIWRRSREDEG